MGVTCRLCLHRCEMARKDIDNTLSSVAPYSSRVSMPIPYVRHKFDILVLEQKKLVENAQDGLQQTISLLQNTTLKDKYESEHLQVESLLSRSQELVVTLQIINELRVEIGHILNDISDAKRSHKEASSLYKRLQWLEQRLEKLLLSRKRGRPGARGRREHPQNLVPFGFQPNHHGCLRSSRIANTRIRCQPSIDGADKLSGDDAISRSLSIRDSPRPTISDFQKKEPISPCHVHRSLLRVKSHSISSKQSPTPSQDSDVWHSESEANWTMVENPLKDITQSQVLSEDEPKEVDSNSHSFSDSAGRESGNCIQVSHVSQYGFEPPRSMEIFGVGSWNSLCLAQNVNLLEETKDASSSSIADGIDLALSMLHAGLIGIIKEIDSLHKLVQAAASAATNCGSLLSLDSSTRLKSRSESGRVQEQKSKAAQHVQKSGSDTCSLLKLPSVSHRKLGSDIESSNVQVSRKVYGSKVSWSHSFPRYSGAWHKNVASGRSNRLSNTIESTSNKQLRYQKIGTASMQIPSKDRNLLKGYQSQRSLSNKYQPSREDIFGSVEHQKKYTEHVTELLESICVETRKESIQAIAMLPSELVSKVMKDKLHKMFLNDVSETVRYTAMKALLLHGVVDITIVKALCHCLEQGSPSLQLGLLRFLYQDDIGALFKQVESHQQLYECLTNLQSSESAALSFEVAVLFAKWRVIEERSLVRLHKALHESSPAAQSSALTCLVSYCGCYSGQVISSAIDQIHNLIDWKLRLLAVKALNEVGIHSGVDLLSWKHPAEGYGIFRVLLKRLVEEPAEDVRVAIGQLITILKLERRAETTLLGNLESLNTNIRAEAVSALSALGVRSQKTIQVLLDCLELDPSIFVRVQVARCLSQMRILNFDVMKRLEEKSRSTGVVALECQAALKCLLKRFNVFSED